MVMNVRRRRISRKSRKPTTARKIIKKARGKNLVRLIKSVTLGMSETKHIFAQDCLNLTLEHNELRIIRNNIFATVQGVDTGERIGDKIFAKGIYFRMYFENQQYRPKASYLVLVLRNKVNPSANLSDGENIFEGVTTSKNLDFIDYNKYQVLYKRRITVNDAGSAYGTANTVGTGGIDGETRVDTGVYVSNPARYHKFNIKLNRQLQYQDASNAPSTMKYCLAVIPYATFSTTTSGATYPVGHVSCVSKFYFKDV